MKIPTNNLDRALMALTKSKSALPRFLRELGTGELWFVTPFHPEIIGEEVHLEDGMRSPFAELQDAEGPYVPVFSSYERLEESLRASLVPENQYAAASMEAVLVLEVLGKMGLRGKLNMGCSTGSMMMLPEMMLPVADGSILEPAESAGPMVTQQLNLIDPSDYPTDLLQPVFEILRQHRSFRAAWVLEHGTPEDDDAPGGRHFQFMIHMEPRDPAVFREFELVLGSAALATGHRADGGRVDETDTDYLTNLWREVEPFYIAPNQVRLA